MAAGDSCVARHTWRRDIVGGVRNLQLHPHGLVESRADASRGPDCFRSASPTGIKADREPRWRSVALP